MTKRFEMVEDDYRPRRHWVLRYGDDGLTHWTRADPDYEFTIPWCWKHTRVYVRTRRVRERFMMPTCIWCARPHMKHVHLPKSEGSSDA